MSCRTLPIPSPARTPTSISAPRLPAGSRPRPAWWWIRPAEPAWPGTSTSGQSTTPRGRGARRCHTTAVETAASLGASLAVRDRGQFAVGVHNATDFLRPATSGRAEVIAEPLQQGRVQQLWLVTITDERGRALARGQLRLQNVPLPGAGTS